MRASASYAGRRSRCSRSVRPPYDRRSETSRSSTPAPRCSTTNAPLSAEENRQITRRKPAHPGSSIRLSSRSLTAQAEQDDRQSRNGETDTGQESPPQADVEYSGAHLLATKSRRRGGDHRGNH